MAMTTKRACRFPVHGSRYFRSMVSMSSPDTERSRSTIWRALPPPRRASETMANGLPMRGDNPKLVPRLARVGPAALPAPTRALRTRAITPLPALVGTISNMIFWRSVRAETT